jgi:hypothetical protein
MDHYSCHQTLVNLRKEPDHRSELVNQVLFGEHVRIIEERKEWYKVESCFDSYSGWAEREVLQPAGPSGRQVKKIITKTLTTCDFPGGSLYLTAGAEIPRPDAENEFSTGNLVFRPRDADATDPVDMFTLARSFLHAPYLWGGRTVFGIDCSGFIQLLFKVSGISLPRDASEQILKGTRIDSLDQAEAGDLAFFHDDNKRIIHVGLLLNHHEIIHASKKVRIDKLDSRGIYNKEKADYSHQLASIRRIQQKIR